MSPAAAFDHAHQIFIQGYLEDSQREAERGYRRFVDADPAWARKFQLLEARAMAWRGLNQDVLTLLSNNQLPWEDPGDKIQRLALEASAMTDLHRLQEAEQLLAEAQALCSVHRLNQCGAVLWAQGDLLSERGQVAQAEESFLAGLNSARSNKDGMQEAADLLDLGNVNSQQERHEEALGYYRLAAGKAMELGAADLQMRAREGAGWEQFNLGDPERALEAFLGAERSARSLGDKTSEVQCLTMAALAYAESDQLPLAEASDLHAIELARTINGKQAISDASMDLSQLYIRENRPGDAERYASQAFEMAKETGSPLDMLNSHLLLGEAAALRHDWPRADALLHEVSAAADSQNSMKWDAEHALGNMYEAEGQPAAAETAYLAALALVERARAELKQEASQLPFLRNAASIYDDYIHFLVAQGRQEEALEAADWNRARTLQQGLGLIAKEVPARPPPFRPSEIARRANATLLFYWLGERQSYLWAISAAKTVLVPLPSRAALVSEIDRYRHALLALRDPLRSGDNDGRALYDTLVAPAAGMVAPGRPVVLFVDGELGQLNFETLVAGAPAPHYWIEDATVLSAPSIRMFAAEKNTGGVQARASGRLLLLGDALSPGSEFPPLPMAALEMDKVKHDFPAAEVTVFQGPRATPAAYLESRPEQYAYIHFATHGTASLTDPLESAIILSRGGPPSGDGSTGDSYKLRAGEILKHRIDARLVTISACNSSGSKSYAGEGLVGLSWAFLRAGAHSAIGSLWEVVDGSTPRLMDRMYRELEEGRPPSTALRDAKLELIHGGGNFSRPFYWAPFQLYSGR